MKQFIEAGKVVTTHGVRGDVKVQPWCDDPAFLTGFPAFCVGKPGVLVEKEGAPWPGQVLKVEKARLQKGMALIKFCGVDDIGAAAALRNLLLYVHRDDIPLKEGEYLVQDLLGLAVVDDRTGEEYGRLCDVTKTGANDVYHVSFPDGAVRLVPVIPQVVRRVDLEGGQVRIVPLEGLFDL